MSKLLSLALVVMAIVVTGCPHNDYIVQLKPQGNVMERTLIFYCADGVNTNTGAPNFKPFDTNELAAITALYPARSLTNNNGQYVVQGEFTNRLPDDVGGAGTYAHLATSLGAAGFYVERFRGNDDIAGLTELRFKAADQLADLVVGWSQMELEREPGYDRLHQFLDGVFRRDLKNFSSYWWAGQVISSYKTNASEEFAVRMGQYLFERGYFTLAEIPGLAKDLAEDDPKALLLQIQRLVARKMGVPETTPAPASLAFITQSATLEKSFANYLAGTEAYQTRLQRWTKDRKLNPDDPKPEPLDTVKDAVNNLFELNMSGSTPDHLIVRLSPPSAPCHSNGRWDETLKQVIWETEIESKTNATRLPFSCYASWAQAASEFQKSHFGKVAITGNELMQYCLWRTSLDLRRGSEWDAFVASLQPGDGLVNQVDAFRWSDELEQAGTNSLQKTSSSSDYARNLLKTALQ